VSYPDPTKKHRRASTRSGWRRRERNRRGGAELQGYYSDGWPVNLAEALRREAR